jgi:putative ABC transport system substrate-binding protein
LAARAQPPDRIRLIGMLMGDVENDPVTQLATFRGALAKLGWTEASNLRIEVRWCADAVPCARHAAYLVALGPKALLAVSTTALAALRRQTRTIPIVFVGVADPVGQGFVASLARPGGNITGFSVFDAPMVGK